LNQKKGKVRKNKGLEGDEEVLTVSLNLRDKIKPKRRLEEGGDGYKSNIRLLIN